MIWNRNSKYDKNNLDEIFEICALVATSKDEIGDGEEWEEGWWLPGLIHSNNVVELLAIGFFLGLIPWWSWRIVK